MIQMEERQYNCPQCGALLQPSDSGEDMLWCKANQAEFPLDEVLANEEWRNLSVTQKVERFHALGADNAARKYYLRPQQLEEVERLVKESASASLAARQSVAPEKEALISLARGISDGEALCELIDNAIDAGRLKRPDRPVTVSIEFEPVLRSLTVTDNAGGMNMQDMRRCLTLGAKKIETAVGIIGHYGIGAKEAIYHFGREVIIRSRAIGEPRGIRTIVSEDWLDDPDWSIRVDHVDDIKEGTTEITINRLISTEQNGAELRQLLWDAYERRIEDKMLHINVNDQRVVEDLQYVPLYPKVLYPRTYVMKCGRVSVAVHAMLIAKPADLSGLFCFAQGRRFTHIKWSETRAKWLIKCVKKHPLNSHIRLEVDFNGPIEDIPISANKNDYQMNGVMELLAPVLNRIIEPYFDAISPLSNGGAMNRANAYTKECAHPDAIVDSAPIDLGRITEKTAIPTNLRGDIKEFKAFLHPALREQPTGEIQTKIESLPDKHPIETQREEKGPLERKSTTVSVSANGKAFRYIGSVTLPDIPSEKVDRVNDWIKTGLELGIQISGEWCPIESD